MFSITVAKAGPVQAAAPVGAISPAGIVAGIMVVEDESDVLDAMVRLLGLERHRVYAGRSAEEVREVHAKALAAGDAPVDLIIADYRLGQGTTGIDAIRALHTYIGRAVPTIIITGDTSPSRLKEVSASGSHILHKPIAGEDLREAILAACLDGRLENAGP